MTNTQTSATIIDLDPSFELFIERATINDSSRRYSGINLTEIEQAANDTGMPGVAISLSADKDFAFVEVTTEQSDFEISFCNRDPAFKSVEGAQDKVQRGVLFALGKVTNLHPGADPSAFIEKTQPQEGEKKRAGRLRAGTLACFAALRSVQRQPTDTAKVYEPFILYSVVTE